MANDTPISGYQPPTSAPAPPLFPASGPQTAQLYPPAGRAPGLPSRATTVVITFFFGVFGAIPAYLHGQEAERRGGSSSRYWTAFAITLAISLLCWIGLLAVFFLAVGESSVVDGVTDVVRAPAPAPEPPN